MLVRLLLLVAVASPLLGGEAPSLDSFFAGEPADSLIRQLEPAAPGPALRQELRWLPELRLVLIEAANAPVDAKEVPLADWTFRVAAGQDGARYPPLTYRNDTWYGSTYWTGPDWTRAGKDWQHPGQDTPSVRRFTCPRDGKVTVTGRVCKAHVDAKTDGVRLFVRHGAKTVWQAEIDGGDAKGVEPTLTLDVRKGDAIRFVVHKRGQIFCDTTHWDPTLTYADGEAFVASKGFSTERQGEGGWSYEMEADAGEKSGLPTLYGFDRDLAFREEPIGVGATVARSERDALPFFVLADGGDRSGLVLAILGSSAWRLGCALGRDGRLRIQVAAGGQPDPLPSIALGAYRGPWTAGMARLGEEGARALFAARKTPIPPALDLSAMVQRDWRQQDKLAETAASYTQAAAHHIEKARQLLSALRAGRGQGFLGDEAAQIERLAESLRRRPGLAEARASYAQARGLKRRLALANPLLSFGKLLFVKRVPTSYSHLVMQYFGWRARPGGGIFLLDKPGTSLAARCIFDAATGNALEPRLSYDASRVVFSYSKCTKDDPFYHIYEMNADGTGLRQLTRGEFEDLMPSYLPDGGIIFCSTRRRGHARCFGGQFGPRWHVYTLHRMEADGSRIRTLSFHETNEWFPTVSPTGHILYSRWDYVDRHPVVHQSLWACRPDGTNPAALWGNQTETPHCTFQLQPIPGTAKVVFTASAHHSITGGSIAIVDPSLGSNGQQAIERITPEVCFPEAEGRPSEYYAAPWPLSQDVFLVAYSPKPLIFEPQPNDPAALGLCLLDRWGNRELLYRDPEIGCTTPIPLVPRPVPPIVASAIGGPDRVGQPPSAVAPPAPRSPQPGAPGLHGADEPTGELVLLNVYEGLGDVPRGTIKALRIVQILPKTTPVADGPRVGLAGQEPTRAVLGTVPVEADGSARFLVPARKPVYFQALDADGFAWQTMRSVTYLQPGEQAVCIGCHENRMTAPGQAPADALRRPPSAIEPGPDGSKPFSFVRLVQPVLDKHCIKCHSGEKPAKGLDLTGAPHDGFTRSYWSLCGGVSFWHGGTNAKNAAEALVPRYGGWNPVHVTAPGGAYGARGSRLMKILLSRRRDARLSADEIRRLALWIDCNAIFYGVYDPAEQARQLRGEAVAMPAIQ